MTRGEARRSHRRCDQRWRQKQRYLHVLGLLTSRAIAAIGAENAFGAARKEGLRRRGNLQSTLDASTSRPSWQIAHVSAQVWQRRLQHAALPKAAKAPLLALGRCKTVYAVDAATGARGISHYGQGARLRMPQT
eukprot:15482726-Alexandrium_andersonii.AAC.2